MASPSTSPQRTRAEESKGAALATPYLAGIGCSSQHRAELGTISHGGGAGPDLRHLTSRSGLSHLLGARLAICPGRGEVGEGFSWSRCPVPCSRFFQPLEKPAADCLANARGSERRLAPQPSSTVGRSWGSVLGRLGRIQRCGADFPPLPLDFCLPTLVLPSFPTLSLMSARSFTNILSA